MNRVIALVCLVVAMTSVGNAQSAHGAEKTIVWDKNTLVRVAPGSYARMARLGSGDILCGFEVGGAVGIARSTDNGKTWSKAEVVAKAPSGTATNSELLVLANGWILYLYNERPNDHIHHFTIQVMISKDNGGKWSHLSTPYVADTEWNNGCWEPSAIQLPSGEVQLVFANENPYRQSSEQEISLARSFDNGRTWSEPKPISFRAGHRDGMPVPLLLANGKGIVVAIEDNGYTQMFSPAIISSSVDDDWNQSYASGASPRRTKPVSAPVSVEWGGAPYIRQMPSGETVLSFQSSVGRAHPQMVVYVGDENARNFGGKTIPFEVPADQGGWWNSLFVKDATTITAISSFNGGVWAIDGHTVPLTKPNP